MTDDEYPPTVTYPDGHSPMCRRSCTHECHEPYNAWVRREHQRKTR
jgi:hypothetical protein